jgi:hypothetical protein
MRICNFFYEPCGNRYGYPTFSMHCYGFLVKQRKIPSFWREKISLFVYRVDVVPLVAYFCLNLITYEVLKKTYWTILSYTGSRSVQEVTRNMVLAYDN